MNGPEKVIDIKILGRTYPIKCSAEEAVQLQESANYLDQQMQLLKQSSGAQSAERLAIVAALNICHEFLSLKRQKNHTTDVMNEQLKLLQQRIQKFLTKKENVMA